MGIHLSEILRRLRLADRYQANPDSDPVLLKRYIDDGDGEAFRVLVHRHGAMVLGVCRRVLGDSHAAEDAFQATFLALARYAATVRERSAVGAWLHGVARRAALRIRGAVARRETDPLTHEPPAPNPVDPLAGVSARELLAALDEELQKLPERHRLAIIHCYLEGQTVDETAGRLGTTRGAVRGWLDRGRARLAARLAARGLSLPSVLLALTAEPVLAIPTAAPGVNVSPAVAAAAESAAGEEKAARRRFRVGWLAIACAVIVVGALVLGAALTRTPSTPTKLVRLGPAGNHVAFSPDGKRLAATYPVPGLKAGVGVWDVTSRDRVLQIEHDRDIDPGWISKAGDSPELQAHNKQGQDGSDRSSALFWSADGNTLGTINQHGGCRLTLWDAATGRELKQVGGLPSATTYALSPDMKTLAARNHFQWVWTPPGTPRKGSGGEIDLIDVATGNRVHRLEGHIGDSVAWSPDGKWLVGGSARTGMTHTIRVWNSATGNAVREWDTGQGVTDWLQFLSDGTLATGPENGIRFWNIHSGELLRECKVGGFATHLALSADGSRVAYKDFVSGVEVANTGTREWLGKYDGGDRWYRFALSPNGRTLATCGGEGLLLWSVPSRNWLRWVVYKIP